MIRHIVLLTLTDPAAADPIVKALGELPAQVPSIVSYSVGRDLGLVNGNATVGVTATFADVAGWEAYAADPIHQRVITELIRPALAGRTAVQLEE